MQKRGRAACFIRAATIGKGVSLLPLKARIQGLSLHRPPDLSAKKNTQKIMRLVRIRHERSFMPVDPHSAQR